ncbi:MAG TPA: hypothetical protein VF049_06650 [Nocardioidaceae bacterium]|jgi:hypothetical protein
MLKTATALLGAAAMLGTTAMAPATASGDDPGTITLRPAKLTRGAPTPVLHGERTTIVDGKTRIRVPVDGDMEVLGRSGRAYVVSVTGPDENWQLLRVTRSGDVRLLRKGTDYVGPQLSLDGRAVATAHQGQGTTRVRVIRARTGELIRSRTFRGYVGIGDYGVHRMVLTEWDNQRSRTFWWNPSTNQTRRISGHPAYVVDVAANRLGLMTKDTPERLCQKVVPLTATSTTLWRSCHYRALEFSPNGHRMITSHILADGPGPLVVQVRGSHGRLQASYRSQLFGSLTWENRRSVLLETAGRKYAAAVRCTAGSGCERVSRLRRVGRFDPFARLAWSFPR